MLDTSNYANFVPWMHMHDFLSLALPSGSHSVLNQSIKLWVEKYLFQYLLTFYVCFDNTDLAYKLLNFGFII